MSRFFCPQRQEWNYTRVLAYPCFCYRLEGCKRKKTCMLTITDHQEDVPHCSSSHISSGIMQVYFEYTCGWPGKWSSDGLTKISWCFASDVSNKDRQANCFSSLNDRVLPTKGEQELGKLCVQSQNCVFLLWGLILVARPAMNCDFVVLVFVLRLLLHVQSTREKQELQPYKQQHQTQWQKFIRQWVQHHSRTTSQMLRVSRFNLFARHFPS